MIPLVGFKKELDLQVQVVHEVAALVQKEKKTKIAYSVGTMIEVPRGAPFDLADRRRQRAIHQPLLRGRARRWLPQPERDRPRDCGGE